MIPRPFAFPHSGFRGLLGDRLVGKQADPDLAASLHKTSHGDAAGFDLPVRDPARLQHFQAEISESQLRSAPGFPRHASALLLAVFHFLWHQHKISSWLLAKTFLRVLSKIRPRPLGARAFSAGGFRPCKPST